MKKQDIINYISDKCEISKKDINIVLGLFTDALSWGLINKGKFMLSGLGVFDTIRIKSKKGTNPRTGEHIQIDPYTKIRFRAATTLKRKLQNEDS